MSKTSYPNKNKIVSQPNICAKMDRYIFKKQISVKYFSRSRHMKTFCVYAPAVNKLKDSFH